MNASSEIYDEYSAKFDDRLHKLTYTLGSTDFPKLPSLASLIFLKKLLSEDGGHLLNLSVEICEDLSGRRMLYELNGVKKILKLDHRLINAFQKVREKTDDNKLGWTIDCFLIHEFLHFAQGMSKGRHSGLGSQSPDTLLSIDYQADALSVIATTGLAWITPENYFKELPSGDDVLWTLYEESIDSIINQMEVFTHLMGRDLDRQKISLMPFSLDKIKRTALWHYQSHRAKNFNRNRSLADFQILSQPRLYYRNLEAAWAYNKSYLCKRWPRQEISFIAASRETDKETRGFEVYAMEKPLCILSTTSQYGTTRFVRIDADADTYKSTFEGFFEADLKKSAKFFEDIFNDNDKKWLVGKSDSGDDSGPGDFGGDDPDPIDKGPPGFSLESPIHERMEILYRYFKPTMFPLTVMEVGALV